LAKVRTHAELGRGYPNVRLAYQGDRGQVNEYPHRRVIEI